MRAAAPRAAHASPRPVPPAAAVTGVWLLVGAVTILFISFTSTLLVRRAEADWVVGPMPPPLWATTAILVASSLAVEWARRGAARAPGAARAGLALALGLGAAFLAGQWVTWRSLVAAGISVASGAHSAFFYLLTGTHALHVAGGLVALAYALRKVGRAAAADAPGVLAPVAVYWHFVDALWLYILVVLFWV